MNEKLIKVSMQVALTLLLGYYPVFSLLAINSAVLVAFTGLFYFLLIMVINRELISRHGQRTPWSALPFLVASTFCCYEFVMAKMDVSIPWIIHHIFLMGVWFSVGISVLVMSTSSPGRVNFLPNRKPSSA